MDGTLLSKLTEINHYGSPDEKPQKAAAGAQRSPENDEEIMLTLRTLWAAEM